MAAAGKVRPQESEVTASSQQAVQHIPLSGDGPQNLHRCVCTCQPGKSPGQSSFTPAVRITRQGAEGHSSLSATSGWGLSSGSPCLSLVVWGGKETLAPMQRQQTLGESPRSGELLWSPGPWGALCLVQTRSRPASVPGAQVGSRVRPAAWTGLPRRLALGEAPATASSSLPAGLWPWHSTLAASLLPPSTGMVKRQAGGQKALVSQQPSGTAGALSRGPVPGVGAH